ncbi:MAG: restriction endonuclease [Anaerolineae bacterium]
MSDGNFWVSVPTFDQLMLPLLEFAGDGQEHNTPEAVQALGQYLQLSEEQITELLPSGKKRKFDDRVQWAKTYLKKAGLLASTGRGRFQITPRGVDVLRSRPAYIDRAFLKQFPEFQLFITPVPTPENPDAFIETVETPRALMHATYQNLLVDLSEDLLDYVLSASPAFFERLVIDLLVAMGYGSSLEDAGKTLGRSGDGGLDGYIKEDKLGLDMIYVQAKRYARDNVVGRPTVQGFVGSLMGAGATRGVLMTTSRFSREAIEYARGMHNLKIILVDGQQLTQLMIEHGVGVRVENVYVIKQVDTEYFEMDG